MHCSIALEEELGFDPFVEMEDPIYPTIWRIFENLPNH